MKKIISCGFFVFPLLVMGQEFSSDIVTEDADTDAPFIYVSAGGGVAGMLNYDWIRWPNSSSNLQIKQPSSENRTVGTINAAIGYVFEDLPVRAEVTYRWFDKAKYTWDQLYLGYLYESGTGTVGSQAVLFNVFLDWHNPTRFIPFIGAGVGYYNNHSSFKRVTINSSANTPAKSADNTNQGVAWSAIAGVKYEFLPNWFIDIRADYTYLGKVNVYEYVYNPQGELYTKGLMKTEQFGSISGLVNLTYHFSLE